MSPQSFPNDPKKPSDPKKEAPKKSALQSYLPVLILLGALMSWNFYKSSGQQPNEVPYSEFFQAAEDGEVKSVEISGEKLQGDWIDGHTGVSPEGYDFQALLPGFADDELLPTLRKQKVEVKIQSEEGMYVFYSILNALLPILFIVLLFTWMSRRAGKMMGGPFSGMMKGRIKKFEHEGKPEVTFDEVAGQKGAKQDLAEIVNFLKHPVEFQRLGARVPRGVLLVGPPGTGKTLLARAVAGEAQVPFYSINGSEFIEMFVGVGASRVRELFESARKEAPAIIFIDEIDAVGRARGAGLGGGHDEREQTLNQMLSEMDGFARDDATIVIAATNRPDVLDPALLRPGRFDRRVVVERPEREARKAILQVHLKGKPVGSGVDLDMIAGDTPGFSGAELANLVNEAALGATRRNGQSIDQIDFRAAYDKIVLGEKRETKLDPEEKRRVAIHEAGHAIAAHFSERTEPLSRVTIIPFGMALGVTQQTPQADRVITTRPELEARLRVLMGGFAAEKRFMGETSTGAASDLQKASELAFKMVAHFGMSDVLGPIYVEHGSEHPFLGRSMGSESNASDAMVNTIETEAQSFLSRALAEADGLLEEYQAHFDALVAALLDKEILEKEELHAVLDLDKGNEAALNEAST